MERIGLIGVGSIGSYYAERLLQAGYALTVLDIDPARLQQAVALGARAAATPAEVAEHADLILLCLPGSHAVEQVMEGEQGLLSRLRPGQLVVDTGTSRPATDVHYAKRCAERGAALIDAPLTWRAAGQIIMVGGPSEHFCRAEPVLRVLSYRLQHVGAIGAGQVLKLINQAILAGRQAVYAEAVEMARGLETDPALLRELLEFDIPEAMLGDDYAGQGQLALHYKDLGYLLELAHERRVQIPLTGLVHEVFKAVRRRGKADWTQAGLVTYWQWLNE